VLAVGNPGWSGVGWVVGFEPRLRTATKGWPREGIADVIQIDRAAALDAKLTWYGGLSAPCGIAMC
jgi:hypothetical protein